MKVPIVLRSATLSAATSLAVFVCGLTAKANTVPAHSNFSDQYGNSVSSQSSLGDVGEISRLGDGSQIYVSHPSGRFYGSEPVLISQQRIGTLRAQDRDSQINVRSKPTANSASLGYGLVGDRVNILQCEVDYDSAGSNLNWCQVKFPGSGLIGWIRSDFIIFPSDGV